MSNSANKLKELRSQYGLLSLKAGTEWEDMDYTEIEHLYSLGQREIPILVKISGPEAKTDLRHLKAIGVTQILGPMIESEYALEKFVTTTLKVYEDSDINPTLAINLETIQGYQKLDSIMNNSYFKFIELIVIGRLDLSLSMHIEDVDHPKITAVTQDIVNKVRQAGKHVSVGGFVNPSSADSLRNINIDRISTVHTLFDLNQVKNIAATIWKAIEFEINYYNSLIPINPERKAFYQSRIEISQAKLDKATALLSPSVAGPI